MLRLILFLTLLAGSGTAERIDKCQIFQTTSISSPCYLEVTSTEDGRPVPSFVYAFKLPHPSLGEPCPVRQSVDPKQRCYEQPPPTRAGAWPSFRLVGPLPPLADVIDESLYVTKPPHRLSFPNPVIRIS